MIRFSAARLEKEPIDLVGDEPAEFLEIGSGEQFEVSAPVHYELHIKAVSGGALVEGRLSTEISGVCGRCLKPVRRPVVCGQLCLFVEIAGMDEVDISEDVRSEMLLELPMNLLCSSECKGLCPHCGADLNQGECGCGGEPPEKRPGPWDELDGLKL